MTNNEFIQDLLAAALESGITDAEVFYTQGESMRAMINKGEIDEYTIRNAGGLSLRGLVDGKMGMSYTEALDPGAMVMLVRGVLESANLISDMDEQYIHTGSPSYATVDALGDRGTPEERIALALRLDELGRNSHPLVKELSHVSLQASRQTTRLVNTHGLDLSHTSDLCYGVVGAIARDGEKVSTGFGLDAAVSLSALDAETIVREAIEEAVSFLDAAPCDSGEMPVILRNTAMSDLIGVFSGIFSAEATQKGLSLLDKKEGERIAAPCITMIDDPLLPGGFFSSGFDGEGVATYTKNVVQDGVLMTLLHNLKTAHKAGVASTGNASRGGYAGPVGISPSNFYVKPGDQDLPALETAMGNGLVIVDVSGLHAGANAVSGDFSLLAKGYLVEGGKRGRAVDQITVAGNFYQLLKDAVAVGSDLRRQPSQVSSPSIWVRGLSIAGK